MIIKALDMVVGQRGIIQNGRYAECIINRVNDDTWIVNRSFVTLRNNYVVDSIALDPDSDCLVELIDK